MKLSSITLDRFGQFEAKRIVFDDHFNVLLGDNEVGKSTIVDALLMTLYGVRRDDNLWKRYKPLDDGPYEATLNLETSDGKTYRIHRDFLNTRNAVISLLDNGAWVNIKDPAPIFNDIGISEMNLCRSTLVVTASDVVLDAKDRKSISTALNMKITSGTGEATGRAALNALNEVRKALAKSIQDVRGDRERLMQLQMEIEDAEQRALALKARCEQARLQYATKKARLEVLEPLIAAHDEYLLAKRDYEQKAQKQAELVGLYREIEKIESDIQKLDSALGEYGERAQVLTNENSDAIVELASKISTLRERVAKLENERAVHSRLVENLEREVAAALSSLAAFDGHVLTPERLADLKLLQKTLESTAREVESKKAKILDHEKRGSTIPALWPALTILVASSVISVFFWPAGVVGAIIGFGLLLARSIVARRARALRSNYERELNEALARLQDIEERFYSLSQNRSLEGFEREYESYMKARSELERLEQQLDRAKERVADFTTGDEAKEIKRLEATMAAILEAAGCRSAEEFQRAVEDYNRLRREKRELEAVRAGLLKGRTPGQVKQELDSITADVITAQQRMERASRLIGNLGPEVILSYRKELESINLAALAKDIELAEEMYNQHRELTMRTDPLDVQAELAEVEGRLRDLEARHSGVIMAIETLTEAIAEVQRNLVPAIETRTGEILGRLTGGRHRRVELSLDASDLEVHLVQQGTGRLNADLHLSSGTRDQLYFGIRIALAEILTAGREFPIILDDPFITFDDTRFKKAISFLGELASTHQVIYVTKDKDLPARVDLAGLRATVAALS
ncbi:MAG TPA: AAA family ATPase [Firmicutes bacterium]|nr:AAA family ATPase [Bacillota bacterium]